MLCTTRHERAQRIHAILDVLGRLHFIYNASQSPPQSKKEGQIAYALPQSRRRKYDSKGESPVALPSAASIAKFPSMTKTTQERLDEREEYQGAPLALTYVSSGGPERWRVTSNARRANQKEGWFPAATHTVLQNYRETGEVSIGSESTLLSKRRSKRMLTLIAAASTDFFPFLANKNYGHRRLATVEEFRLEAGGRIFQGA
ncbi:hypothetical protein B0H14DRAFT_2578003 [Mycena olivaceomarginata]|nr:hypothetical protein B0H14DRAFT_2578003 [Mycena olivaceomarginata]